MSTKSTLSCTLESLKRRYCRSSNQESGKLRLQLEKALNLEPTHFHLYTECFDGTETVYLELRGKVDFQASPGMITIAIPNEVWRLIGHPDYQVKPQKGKLTIPGQAKGHRKDK